MVTFQGSIIIFRKDIHQFCIFSIFSNVTLFLTGIQNNPNRHAIIIKTYNAAYDKLLFKITLELTIKRTKYEQ